MTVRLAVLFSGSGTTLQNIIDHIDRRELDARIVCAISSRPGVKGIERAQTHGIPTATIARRNFSDTESFSSAVWSEIRKHPVDLVVLAGFMSLLTVPGEFAFRIINIHPALIPSFCGQGMYGHHVHEAVLDYGAKVSGATVHYVDGEYDHGAIIMQQAVPVLEDDTTDTLADRVQATEREIYPKAIQLIAEGRIKLEGRRVRVLPKH